MRIGLYGKTVGGGQFYPASAFPDQLEQRLESFMFRAFLCRYPAHVGNYDVDGGFPGMRCDLNQLITLYGEFQVPLQVLYALDHPSDVSQIQSALVAQVDPYATHPKFVHLFQEPVRCIALNYRYAPPASLEPPQRVQEAGIVRPVYVGLDYDRPRKPERLKNVHVLFNPGIR